MGQQVSGVKGMVQDILPVLFHKAIVGITKVTGVSALHLYYILIPSLLAVGLPPKEFWDL